MGQIISFVTLPIITRMYGADIIGIWAIVTAISAVFNAVSDVGLSKSIMLEDNDYLLDTYNVVSTISFFSSFLLGCGTFAYFYFFPSIDNLPAIIMGLLIGVYSWLAKQVDICYTWLNREQKYRILMRNPVINQLAIAAVSICLGLMGFTKYGYYIGFISGTFFTIVNMKSNLPIKTFTLKISKFERAFNVHKNFIIFQTPADLFGQIKNTLPIFLLKEVYGSTAVGYYSISIKLLNAPVNLLGMSVGRVFYSELGRLKRDGQVISKFIEKNVNLALKTATPIFMTIFAFGDVFATTFLGKDWYVAGEMLRIMCFMSMFTFVALSTQCICIVIGKQKYTLAYSVAQIVMGIFSFVGIGMLFESLLLSIAAYMVSVVLIQIVYYSFIYKAVRLRIINYLKHVVMNISIIILGAAILRLIAMQFSIVNTILL